MYTISAPSWDFLISHHMFTGIISHLGKLNKKQGSVFTFKADNSLTKKLQPGASITVNGTCLTVFRQPTSKAFSVALMPETEMLTMLKNLKLNDLVNLELPATPKTFLSGHLVSGHIDGTARLQSLIQKGNSYHLKFTHPKTLAKYIVKKGSIAVNGISLTIIEAGSNYFTVDIIPYTWQNTMLHKIKINESVNLEVDLVAKYLEKLLARK